MLTGSTIVYLGSIDWRFNWQVVQEVAAGLARMGNRVLYVENTGIRRPRLSDARRLGRRAVNWLSTGGRPSAAERGPDVLAPVLLPFPYAPAATALNARVLLRNIHRWVETDARRGPLVVVTFLPTPLARTVARELQPDLFVYYCADNLPGSSPGARSLVAHEHAVFAEADLIVATTAGLAERAAAAGTRVEVVPNGVRFAAIQELCRGRETAAARAARGRPIVGYVGTLGRAQDLTLLASVADLAPDLSFVLVGPADVSVNALRRRPNVTLVGPLPHLDAMRRLVGFDVGILPYAHTPYTLEVESTKLKEYLAGGLPVVGTGIPENRRFAALHPGALTIADDPVAFTAAIRSALGRRTTADIAWRRAIARGYDWDRQLSVIGQVMQSTLVSKARPLHISASA